MRHPEAVQAEIVRVEAELQRLAALIPPLEAENDRMRTLLDPPTELWTPATWEGPAAERGYAELVAQRERLARVVGAVNQVVSEITYRLGMETRRLGDLQRELGLALAEQERVLAELEAQAQAEAAAAAAAAP